MLHGWILLGAIEAGVTEPTKDATPSFGSVGSVVLGEVVAARALTVAPAPVGVIGAGPGPLSAGWLSFGSTQNDAFRTRSIAAEPAFDVFVGPGYSLGAVVGAGVTHLADDGPSPQEVTLWHGTLMPRVGLALDIADGVSLWPRAALGFTFFEWAAQGEVAKVFRATADAPFVFRLTRHVALQTGPQVSYFNHLGGPREWRGFAGGVSGGLSIVL